MRAEADADHYVDFFDVDTARALDPAIEAQVSDLTVPEQMSVLSQLCQGAISPVFSQQVAGRRRHFRGTARAAATCCQAGTSTSPFS